ncbi:MAG: hypothetical protein Ct9H300mP11_33470 [Chloroflexota bacterium]|nr:MAG: hypothetical protein Ct9H300mP11_33470 [Chloroflexota bacterium]
MRVYLVSRELPLYGDQDPMAGHLAMMLRTGKFAARSFLFGRHQIVDIDLTERQTQNCCPKAFHWAFEGDNTQTQILKMEILVSYYLWGVIGLIEL